VSAHFNLIDEPWIPCVPIRGGVVVERSILEVLTNASAYREIYDNSPLVTVSLHRLLLAILYRACGPRNLKEARALVRDGLPVGAISSRLDQWHDRFDLFDEQHPFYQTAGMETGKLTAKKGGKEWTAGPVSIIRLANEAPDKNQPTLFDHRTYSDREAMSPAEAARYLVAAQSYALSSSNCSSANIAGVFLEIPGGCTQCPGIEGIWCWLSGENLGETLLLNLVSQQDSASDIAAWEMDDALTWMRRSWTERQLPRGIADRYSWQTRMIRIVPNETASDLVVNEVFFTQGRSPAKYDDDPMCAYARGEAADPWRPMPLRRDRAAWRDSHALLKKGGNVRQPQAVENASNMLDVGVLKREEYTLNVVGLARGREAAKQVLWRHDRLPAPAALLKNADLVERLGDLLQRAEGEGKSLRSRTRELCSAYLSVGGRKPDPDAVNTLAEEIDPRRSYWARLEGCFYALLRELPKDKEAASEQWHKAVAQEARKAFDESANQLGQSARAIRARALVRPRFDPRRPSAGNAAPTEEVSE
jgi:CRISPR system Cascade subunit CasA